MAIGLFGLLAPVQADAACTSTELAGTWKTYAYLTDNVDSGWSRCTIKVGSGGNVKTTTSCKEKEAGTGATRVRDVTGGSISVQSNCKISGDFSLDGCKNTISEGWISTDATVVSGVGRDCSGFIFLFNGIKR